MNKQTLDQFPDLEIHFLQLPVTEDTITAHWNKIRSQISVTSTDATIDTNLPEASGESGLV
jgi:hypothetical protein